MSTIKQILVSALVTVSFSTLAHARDNREPIVVAAAPVEIVAVGDLNLRAPSGRATMVRRVEAAAHNVCGGYYVSRELPQQAWARKCYTRAMSSAQPQIDSLLERLKAKQFASNDSVKIVVRR
jgi:UrcA family protein